MPRRGKLSPEERIRLIQRYMAGEIIDNGPMDGFRGILKREQYYGRRYTGKQDLIRMIIN